VFDFFYLNKWLISTPSYHLPFLVISTSSTQPPLIFHFLSLFLSLSSSSSPFSYKYQPHSSLQNTNPSKILTHPKH
jgi:hypothetical protein